MENSDVSKHVFEKLAAESAVDTAPRLIVRPPRDEQGLFVQPKPQPSDAAKAKREMQERLNRMMFAEVFKYADKWTGNTATFHEEGNYNCGDCNKQYAKANCTLIPIAVDKPAGSCQYFEIRRACDQELDVAPNPEAMTAELAMYGVAKNGEGFGCHRCPYSEKAYEADSLGRDHYCKQGDFRIPGNACCALNGAPLVSEYEGNKEVKKGV